MSGTNDRQALLDAGFAPEEVLSWEANQRKSLMQAGFAQDDIDKHFGTAPYDNSKIRSYFRSAWETTFGGEDAPTFKQAWDAGFQGSVTGLAVRGQMPDVALPENAPVAQRVVSGAATMAGDFPAMVAGAIIGGGAGAAGGGGAGAAGGTAVAPGPGTVVGGVTGAATGAGIGAFAGSFALPAGLRAVMVDAYSKGEIDSFSRFWEALSTAVTEEFKGYVVGAATGAAGTGVRSIAASRAVAGLEGSAAAQAAAQATSRAAVPALGAEIGTMVTVGAALEGHAPEPSEFLDAAILLGGAKAAGGVASKLRSLYAKTGVRPVDVIEDAKADPTIKQDILASNVEVPKAYEARVEELPGEAAKGLPANATKAVEGEVLEPGKAPASRDTYAELPQAGVGKGGGGEPPKFTDAEFTEAPKELPGPKAEAEITDPWEKVRSRIDVGSHDPKDKMTLDRLYSMFIDDMHALPGKEKDVADSPYKLFRLTRGSQGRADHFLEYGTFDAKTYKNNGEGLRSILRPLEEVDGGFDRLRTYAVARRTEELNALSAERSVQFNAAKGEANRARENAAAMQSEIDARKGELSDQQFRSMQEAVTAWKDKAAEHDKAAAALEKKQMKDDPTGVDPVAASEVVLQGRKEYEPILRKLVDFQNRVTAYLRDSGVLSKEAFDAMTKANEQYIPFYRLLEPDVGSRFGTGRGLGARNPIHRIKGSDLKIVDPLESIIKNTYTYIALADRNEAGVKLIDLLTNKREVSLLPMERAEAASKAAGTEVPPVPRDTKAGEAGAKQIEGGQAKLESKAEGEIVRVEEATDKVLDTNIRQALEEAGVKEVPEDLIAVLRTNTLGDGNIAVFMDGKRTVWKVSKDIEAAFKAVDQETANLIIRMLAVPARWLRSGSTVTPEFISRNAVRDLVTAFINSKGLFTPLDTLGGLMHTIKKDGVYQAWLKSGGANSAMVSLDRRYLQENLFKLHESTGFMGSAWNVVKTPYAILRVVSELMENATRVGEFSKIAKDENAPKADLLKAGYASREVTLDFSRVGSKMRALNMIAAFANAHVQGIDRVVREAKSRPLSFTLKAVAGITAPSVALWWANKDDERWGSIPRWQKDMFWIVMTDDWQPVSKDDAGVPEHLLRTVGGQRQINKGTVYRIPKPFEIGLIFGALPERALEAMHAENPDAFKGFGNSLFSALAPNFMPTALAPYLEAKTNYSFFMDAPIVPAYLEKELPEYRYQPYTTELAKGLGSVLGSIPSLKHSDAISPIMLENYVRDWTGGLGMHLMQTLDKNLKLAGIAPDPVMPADTLSDIPFIRAFAVRYPSGNAQEIRDFYDRHKQVSQVMATVKDLAQHGDFEAVEREMRLAPDAALKLDGIADAISMQSKFIREVYKMPDLTPDDKRQLIDTAYFQMIAVAKQGNQMAEQAKKILSPE